MSAAIDSIEAVFENSGVTAPPSPVAKAMADLERVRQLRSRIGQVEGARLESPGLRCAPELAAMLPELRPGSVYSVTGSSSLAMAVMAGPMRDGAWCGVVGAPGFGVEAAATMGLDLSRLVLVPRPGRHWFAVTAALADSLPLVVTAPAGTPSSADAERFAARLRQRGAVLIALGDWPRCDARLSVVESSWSGVGAGWGYPGSRQITVAVTGKDGRRSRLVRLSLQAGGAAMTTARPIERPAIRAVG